MPAQVAVVIPGIMGSELSLGQQVVWPGTLAELVVPYNKMKELLSSDVEPTGIIRSVSIFEQYDDLLTSLTTCGFVEDANPATLLVCPYDWRKSNEVAAERLAALIEKADVAHGGELDISLIGHSMGGLVSRFYLESGNFNSRAGFGRVRRLITLGTPHLGAPVALMAALGMEKRLFLNANQVQEIANDVRYPSLYQLLPPEGDPFVWDDDPDSRFAPVSVYESAIVTALKLVPQNIASAQEFHRNLDVAKKPKAVDYFFFYGTRQQTPASIYLRNTGQGAYRVRKLELDDAGDGTVPVWSGMYSRIQGLPVGGEHGTIYKNGMLKSVLATLLGKKGVLAAPVAPELAIRDHVVHPDAKVHAVTFFPRGIESLKADFRLTRVIDAQGNPAQGNPYRTAHPITYSGAPIDTIAFVFPAPQYPGIYRVELMVDGGAAASDDLFVQSL